MRRVKVEEAAARWSKASSKSSGKAGFVDFAFSDSKASALNAEFEKDVLEKQATDLTKQISTSLLQHQEPSSRL